MVTLKKLLNLLLAEFADEWPIPIKTNRASAFCPVGDNILVEKGGRFKVLSRRDNIFVKVTKS
jgi:hypothetical protein